MSFRHHDPTADLACELARAAIDWTGVMDALKRGADVDTPSHDGWTALMWAAWLGRVDLVRRLLARGASVEARNADGWTALVCTAWGPLHGAEDVVRSLVIHGADPLAVFDDDLTVLDVLEHNGRRQLIAVIDTVLADGSQADARMRVLRRLPPERRIRLLPQSCTAQAACGLRAWRRGRP